jgi:hypothetical protein
VGRATFEIIRKGGLSPAASDGMTLDPAPQRPMGVREGACGAGSEGRRERRGG